MRPMTLVIVVAGPIVATLVFSIAAGLIVGNLLVMLGWWR